MAKKQTVDDLVKGATHKVDPATGESYVELTDGSTIYGPPALPSDKELADMKLMQKPLNIDEVNNLQSAIKSMPPIGETFGPPSHPMLSDQDLLMQNPSPPENEYLQSAVKNMPHAPLSKMPIAGASAIGLGTTYPAAIGSVAKGLVPSMQPGLLPAPAYSAINQALPYVPAAVGIGAAGYGGYNTYKDLSEGGSLSKDLRAQLDKDIQLRKAQNPNDNRPLASALNAPNAAKLIGSDATANMLQNNVPGAAVNLENTIAGALKGGIGKAGQFISSAVQPITSTADAALGGIQTAVHPIVDSRLFNLFGAALANTAYGPGSNFIIKNVLGGNDIYETPVGQNQSQGQITSETTPKKQVYTMDEATGKVSTVKTDAADSISNQVTANMSNTPYLNMELNRTNFELASISPSMMKSPLVQAHQKFLTDKQKSLQDAVKASIEIDKGLHAAGNRFGNYEADSDVAKNADAAGKSVSTLNDLSHKIIKAGKSGDMAAQRALMQTAMDQIRPIEGVRPTGPQGAAFDAAYGHVSSLLGGPDAIQAFLPQNLPGTIKAIEALRDIEEQEFNRQANKAGADDRTRQIYLNSGKKMDNEWVVVADNDGNPLHDEKTKKFIQPIIKGLDENGSPVYSTPVTTIEMQYDPSKEIAQAKKELEKGIFFTPEQIAYQQNYQNQVNKRLGIAKGQSTVLSGGGVVQGIGNALGLSKGSSIVDELNAKVVPATDTQTNVNTGTVQEKTNGTSRKAAGVGGR